MVNKSIVKRNFSKYAHLYDRYTDIQRKCAEGLISLIPKMRYGKILEIGCGTGTFTKMLHEVFPGATISSVDTSADMINMARDKVGDKNVNFILGDAEDMDFSDKYDLITSNASFQWFEDIASALVAYTGMLNERGLICFSVYGPQTFCELNEVLSTVLSEGNWLSAGTFADKQRIERALDGNYSGVQLKEEIYKEEFQSLLDFLRSVQMSGTRGDGFIRKTFLGKDLLARLEDEYIERFGGITVTHQIFTGIGRK